MSVVATVCRNKNPVIIGSIIDGGAMRVILEIWRPKSTSGVSVRNTSIGQVGIEGTKPTAAAIASINGR